jgi:ubiquinone/menaquinone biosynthesis C-methylase UbiE
MSRNLRRLGRTAVSARLRPWLGALAALVVIAAPLLRAQQGGIHPLSGRRFAEVMDASGASWLDRPEREIEEAPDEALNIIGVKKGTTVADVGAGSGYMTVKLAKKVGAGGVVYAVDIQQRMLDLLDARLKSAKLTNVRPVLSAVDDPKLPPASIDLALMVDVYHEFSQPQAMLQRLHEALKPGARMVLLEYRKEDPSIPIRPEHKMSVDEARKEIEPEGFKLTRVDDELPRQHVLIFTRR